MFWLLHRDPIDVELRDIKKARQACTRLKNSSRHIREVIIKIIDKRKERDAEMGYFRGLEIEREILNLETDLKYSLKTLKSDLKKMEKLDAETIQVERRETSR